MLSDITSVIVAELLTTDDCLRAHSQKLFRINVDIMKSVEALVTTRMAVRILK
jgi:hypothetical protein